MRTIYQNIFFVFFLISSLSCTLLEFSTLILSYFIKCGNYY
uniref:Lipoprotein n=1 Tax=Spyridia filamentosa TaxID=196632 RepID=A0A1Z1MJK1_SPYFI|nr:hypothetical protein [Spyridia filamentosa]ARW66247.1 hypothetical protein [Spyridia filamentosa]